MMKNVMLGCFSILYKAVRNNKNLILGCSNFYENDENVYVISGCSKIPYRLSDNVQINSIGLSINPGLKKMNESLIIICIVIKIDM